MTESKSVALPLGYTPKMVEEGGFGPPNPKELIYSQPRLATSLLLHVLNEEWWMLTGSNRRPPPCKGDALPAELNIHGTRVLI